MANIQEKTSFDSVRGFTANDLDLSWAYLQVKKLWEAEVEAGGAMTITPANFKAKVLEQYTTNQSANIAETNSASVSRLPGILTDGQPAPEHRVNYIKHWTVNDMFKESPWNNRDSSKPNNLIESISGTTTGTSITGTKSWADKTAGRTDPPLTLTGSDQIRLNDDGALRNNTSWTLHFKAKVASFTGSVNLVQKGTFKVQLFDTDRIKLVIDSSRPVWFSLGGGKTGAQLKGGVHDFYISRDGQEMTVIVDTDEAILGRQTIVPNVLKRSEYDSPIIFRAAATTWVNDIWISDNTLAQDIVTPGGASKLETDTYRFRSDLNHTRTWLNWRNFFSDRHGNWAEMFGGQWESNNNSATHGTHWVDAPANDVRSGEGTYTSRAKCLQMKLDTRKLEVMNVNFASNFTVSFWMKTSKKHKFLKFNSVEGTGAFQLGYAWSPDTAIKYKINDEADKSKNIGVTTGSDNTWTHVTMIKNRDLLGFWFNGATHNNAWLKLSTAQIDAIGNSNLHICGTGGNGVYVSDLRVLDYAKSHIPANGYMPQTSWPFIDELKTLADS